MSKQGIAALSASLVPAPAPAAAAPARLGFASAASNSHVVSATVTDIDDFARLTFGVRAARTAAAALAVATPHSVTVDVPNIPINTNPISGARLTLAVPGAGNIVVSRSRRGRMLFFLGQDAVAAFGITIDGERT